MVFRYAVPIVSTAVAILLTRSLDLSVFPTPLFFAAIVASTWYGGVLPGFLSIVFAVLALDYYFIPSPRTLAQAVPHLLQFALPALLTLRFVKKRRDAEFSLTAARDELELKVQQRTAALRSEIAEREKAEATVHQTQSQLAHVNRVMTMGELATSIAHELNQPLMAVVVNGDACLQWLNGAQPNLGEARAAVTRMVSESSRAGEIIKRIRALSQNSSPQKEPVSLHDVIADTLTLANGELAANKIAVTTELTPGLPPLLGDRVQLQQVILNLVVNAIEAMTPLPPADRRLRISTGRYDANCAVVTVADSGAGISPEQLDRVFDAFFTTKPQGIGMGLSISRTIVEAHAGRIWSDSAGAGATLHFTIPFVQGAR
jgi:C4-dicarboxylate-specific signal transduction histidine kinase